MSGLSAASLYGVLGIGMWGHPDPPTSRLSVLVFGGGQVEPPPCFGFGPWRLPSASVASFSVTRSAFRPIKSAFCKCFFSFDAKLIMNSRFRSGDSAYNFQPK